MKHYFPSIFLGLTIVASSVPLHAQQALLDSALEKTQTENFEGAIQDLRTANNFFVENKDWENAYKSTALITLVTDYLEQKNALEAREGFGIPEWYKLGSCIGGNDLCEYSVAWLTPSTIGADFDGILVLQKSLRDLPTPDGGTSPVQSIIDAQVVPKLKGGEWLSSNCTRQGQQGMPILAIYQTRGFENAEQYTQVSRAWQVNLKTKMIEAIPPTNVACVNNCPGGC